MENPCEQCFFKYFFSCRHFCKMKTGFSVGGSIFLTVWQASLHENGSLSCYGWILNFILHSDIRFVFLTRVRDMDERGGSCQKVFNNIFGIFLHSPRKKIVWRAQSKYAKNKTEKILQKEKVLGGKKLRIVCLSSFLKRFEKWEQLFFY